MDHKGIKSKTSSADQILFKLAILPVLFGLAAYFMMTPAFIAQAAYFMQQQMGLWSPCFFENKIVSSFSLKHHDEFFGTNPPLVEPTPVTEMALSDYSHENLRIVSKNWTEPVVVRKMFANSPALKWADNKDLLSPLNKFNVSVVQNSTMGKDHHINCGTHPGKDAVMTNFGDAVKQILDYDPKSMLPSKTIVLPPASRSHRETNYELDAEFHKLVERDLDMRSFGGDWAKLGNANSVITQLWLGNGHETARMGTGWHQDICNSFIVHLQGAKTWTFISNDYSNLMRKTMKQGKSAAQGTDLSTKDEVVPYLPRLNLTLEAGDFLYNPDFYWHNVKNEPGFTMAINGRECKFDRYFKNDPVFTTTILLNHLKAAVFEQDGYAWERIKKLVSSIVESKHAL